MTENGSLPPEPFTNDRPRTPAPSGQHMSGFEVADKVASGAGAVAHGIGWLFTKVWGLLLLAGGIAALVGDPGKLWWAALLMVGYGLYLVFPGSKTVVW